MDANAELGLAINPLAPVQYREVDDDDDDYCASYNQATSIEDSSVNRSHPSACLSAFPVLQYW